MAVLGPPSLTVLVISVDVTLTVKWSKIYSPRSVLTELRSCVKVEVAVLGSPSLIILVVSVNVALTVKGSDTVLTVHALC